MKRTSAVQQYCKPQSKSFSSGMGVIMMQFNLRWSRLLPESKPSVHEFDRFHSVGTQIMKGGILVCEADSI